MILVVFLAGYLSENRALLVEQDTRLGPAPAAAAAVSRADGRDVGDRPRDRRRPARPRRGAAVLRRLPGAARTRRPGGSASSLIGLVLFLLGSAVMANLFEHVRTRIDIWLDPFADPLGAGYQVDPGAPRVRARRAARHGPRRRAAGGRRPAADPGGPHRLPAGGARRGARASSGSSRSSGSTSSSSSAACGSASAAADDFRSLLAIGLALVIGIQAFIIAAGNLKVLPLTGVTLPFISYGGSSLLANAPRRRAAAGALRQGRRAAAAAARAVALAPARAGGRPPDARTRRRRAGRSAGPTIHVALVLSLAFALARRRGRLLGRRPRARPRRGRPTTPAVIAAARTVPRGPDPRPGRDGPGPQRGGRERRAVPGLRQPGRSARSSATPRASYGRAGLERAYDAELTRPGRRPADRRASPSSGRTATTPRT